MASENAALPRPKALEVEDGTQNNLMAWGREPFRFFVECFLLGSNESIPHPGFFFQQQIIAKVIAKLEHLDH